MPNQLAKSKKRKTVAEHAAVLAMLDLIAEKELTTSTELIREAARSVIRRYTQVTGGVGELVEAFETFAPKLPADICKPKDLARFKIECREYDELALDLGLRLASDVQEENSIHRISGAPVLIGQL